MASGTNSTFILSFSAPLAPLLSDVHPPGQEPGGTWGTGGVTASQRGERLTAATQDVLQVTVAIASKEPCGHSLGAMDHVPCIAWNILTASGAH